MNSKLKRCFWVLLAGTLTLNAVPFTVYANEPADSFIIREEEVEALFCLDEEKSLAEDESMLLITENEISDDPGETRERLTGIDELLSEGVFVRRPVQQDRCFSRSESHI